jgi:hypothetical protein
MGDKFFYAVLVVSELLGPARANAVVVTEKAKKAAMVKAVVVKAVVVKAVVVKAAVVKAVVVKMAVKVKQAKELL